MSLRIIGGQFKNRLLKAPKGSKTRPTLAILRKAVFDMLQFSIADTRFLDLFAGSGVMGMEALSRGARHAAFIDADRTAIHCIRDNLKLLQLEERSEVHHCDAFTALKKYAHKKISFDVIYIDPPYKLSKETPILQELLQFIDAHSLLASGGIALVEEAVPPQLDPKISLAHLHFVNTRSFSDSVLHQYAH